MRRAALKVVPIAEVSTFDDGRDDRRARPAARGARPGHADGSCAILLEARRALITGDALATRNPLTRRVGRQIGPDGLKHDSDQAMGSLDRLAGLPADLVLPATASRGPTGIAEAVRLARLAGRS